MHNLEPILREHPFFKGLEPGFLEVIVGCASNVVFKDDELIFREGEKADHFYIIRQGKVALELFVPGREPVMVATLGEGEVFGWSWLLAPYRWHFDAHAREQTRAIVFDAACLRNKCETDHDFGYELFKRFSGIIADRLQATRLQMLDIYGAVPE